MKNICVFIHSVFFNEGEEVGVILRIINHLIELLCEKNTSDKLLFKADYLCLEKCLEGSYTN